MKNLITLLALLPFLAQAQNRINMLADTNGVLLAPTNLFVSNSNLLNQSVTHPVDTVTSNGLMTIINLKQYGSLNLSNFSALTTNQFVSTNAALWLLSTNNGSGLTNLNASELRSGTVPVARLSGITSNQLDLGTQTLLSNAVQTSSFQTTNASLYLLSTNNGSGLTNLNASELRSGTVPLARLAGVSTNELDQGSIALFTNLPSLAAYQTGSQNLTNFANLTTNAVQLTNASLYLLSTNNGSGLTNLNGSNIASGTVPDARLSANVSLLGSSIDLSGSEATGTLAPARAGSISNHTDVSAGAFVSGGYLGYNGTTGLWTNGLPTAGGAPTFGVQFQSGTGTNLAVGFNATNSTFAATNSLTVGGGTNTIAGSNVFEVHGTNGALALSVTSNGVVNVSGSTNALIQLFDGTGTNWVGIAPNISMVALSNYTLRLPPNSSNTVMSGIYTTNSGTFTTNVQMRFSYLWFTNVTLDFPQITSANSTNLNFDCPGAVTNTSVVSIVTVNPCVVPPVTFTNKVMYVGFVSNIANTAVCVIQAINFSGGNVNPPSGVFSVKVEQFQ